MINQLYDGGSFSDGVRLIKKRDLPGWEDSARRMDELDRAMRRTQEEAEEAKSRGYEAGYKIGVEAGREAALKEVLVLKQKATQDLSLTEATLVGLVNSVARNLLGGLTDEEKVRATLSTYFKHTWSSLEATIYVHPSKVSMLEAHLYTAEPQLRRVVHIRADAELRSDQVEFEEGHVRFDITLADQFEPLMLELASALNAQKEQAGAAPR